MRASASQVAVVLRRAIDTPIVHSVMNRQADGTLKPVGSWVEQNSQNGQWEPEREMLFAVIIDAVAEALKGCQESREWLVHDAEPFCAAVGLHQPFYRAVLRDSGCLSRAT